MLKRIITLCIAGALGLLVLAILWPTRAETIAMQLLKGVSNLRTAEVPLLGRDEPPIKIVDPDTIPRVISEIPSTVKKDASVLSEIVFKRWTTKPAASAALTIEDVVIATNNERIAAGLPPLQVNNLLVESAKIKTDDMIANQYFEHESPTGVSVSDLGNQVGYDYIIMGENLALGNFDDSTDLVTAWMNSPGHRANILNPLYQDIGVYAAKATYQGHTVWFAVQHFATKRTVCPTISTAQKKEIDILNAELSRRKVEISVMRDQLENRTSSDGEEYQAVVNKFNKLVDEYNQLLSTSRQEINAYNKTVANFNACLLKYQMPKDAHGE